MTHAEIEELLGAFALDAVEPDEAAEISEHLSGCPRCRAEVAAHREIAAMLGNAGDEAPPGLWDKIAEAIAADAPPVAEAPPSPVLGSWPQTTGSPDRKALVRARLRWGAPLAAVASVAAAAVVVLAVEVASLHGQVGRMNAALARTGLSAAVAQTAIGPHRTIQLTAADHSSAATIIVSPAGDAYWVSSSLKQLPSQRTYQLWGIAHGKVVSLGLVGADPHTYAGFKVQGDISQVMVTAEPEGGTPAPTTPVLAQGPTGQSV
jgi:anti-sigma factor RsiW